MFDFAGFIDGLLLPFIHLLTVTLCCLLRVNNQSNFIVLAQRSKNQTCHEGIETRIMPLTSILEVKAELRLCESTVRLNTNVIVELLVLCALLVNTLKV